MDFDNLVHMFGVLDFSYMFFSKEQIELEEEIKLDQINSLAKKYSLSEFCTLRYRDDRIFKDDFEEVFVFKCLNRKKEQKMSPEFEICCKLSMKFDCLGSFTWSIQPRKIVILFYFNDENIDIQLLKDWLTLGGESSGLASAGRKLLFELICSRPEKWINDYYKKVESVLKN